MVEPPSVDSGELQGDPLDNLFDCLASSDRRRIIGLVLDRAPDPVSRPELATALAGWMTENPRDKVTNEDNQQAAIALHHVHLPKLTASGLLAHDADGDTVVLTDHPAFQDPGFLEAVEGDGPTSGESLDAFFEAIASERRRTILDVLSHQIGSIHVETLARELGADELDTTESDISDAVVNRIMMALNHVDLPHLAAAGLVEYDADRETVAYEGHPVLRVPWMHSVLQPEFRQSLTGESNADGIGEIQGREQIISFGQSICGRADEELFCMFTDTQLIEAGCLTRIRDAARRGTNVYLGTRDPDVRAYVRENAPEVILWEPNTDWLNLPVAGDRVGRLLLADREAVMLGTLLERKTDGFHDEQAIVGEGEHNTLVTMICQLLGPHLEEIDKDTEDIELRLPV